MTFKRFPELIQDENFIEIVNEALLNRRHTYDKNDIVDIVLLLTGECKMTSPTLTNFLQKYIDGKRIVIDSSQLIACIIVFAEAKTIDSNFLRNCVLELQSRIPKCADEEKLTIVNFMENKLSEIQKKLRSTTWI